MKLLILIAILCNSHHAYGEDSLNQSQIVSGRVVDISAHPSMAFLVIMPVGVKLRTCDGTVISDLFVLTNAYCIREKKIFVKIYVGQATIKEMKYYYSSESTHPHDQYKENQPDFNAGLVKTTKKIIFYKRVQPATLAAAGLYVKLGDVLTIVGWGSESEKRTLVLSNYLKAVEIPVVDFDSCKAAYKPKNVLLSSYKQSFCANPPNGGAGPCNGDGGGPAINKNHVQYGIINSGWGCAEKEYPAIFTSVGGLRDWIHRIANV